MAGLLEGTEAAAQRFVSLLDGIWSLVELDYHDARHILDVDGEDWLAFDQAAVVVLVAILARRSSSGAGQH